MNDYNEIVNSVAARCPYVSIGDLCTVPDPGGVHAAVVNGVPAPGSDGVHRNEAADAVTSSASR